MYYVTWNGVTVCSAGLLGQLCYKNDFVCGDKQQYIYQLRGGVQA